MKRQIDVVLGSVLSTSKKKSKEKQKVVAKVVVRAIDKVLCSRIMPLTNSGTRKVVKAKPMAKERREKRMEKERKALGD